MAEKGAGARIAGAAAFVSMADEGGGARIAGAAAFVSMAEYIASARIAGAAAFVSMAGKGAGARIAGYSCLTFCRSVYHCALYEMHHRTLYMSIKLAGRKCTMQRPWSSGSSSSIYKRKSGEATKGEI